MRTAILHGENAPITCGIAVMAKASIPGRTKTRLVPPLTFDEAAQCNTAFLRDVAENVVAASTQAAITGYVAFGPPQSKPFFQDNLPPEIGLIDAWHSNLGDCLSSTIAQLLERGHRGAVVLNSDSPTLPMSVLLEAVDVLARPGEHIVLGPASDGGYYLLGLRRNDQRLFQDIAWGSEHVAQQTLDRAAELALPVHLLPEWYDVDDIGAFNMLQAELLERRSFAAHLRSNEARHTRALMQTLIASADLQARLALNDAFWRAAE
jgi:rSAM/selenodomain-associated transferase 1